MINTSRDSYAKEYNDMIGDSGNYEHQQFLNPSVLELLGDIAGKKVLDLACGQGYFARIMRSMGAEVYACDLSEKLIEYAIAYEKLDKPSIKYIVCSADDLPYDDGTFDLVLCHMAVHDMENIDAVFAESARVLKTGGSLVFSTTHPIITMNKRESDSQGYGLMVRSYKSHDKKQRENFGNTWIFHRPLDYYFQELFANKFLVSNFKEISPVGEDSDTAKMKYKEEIPMFIVVKALKV